MIHLKVLADRQQVSGFVHLWAKYVTGFVPTKHCLPCLIGHRSTQISRVMACTGEWLEMAETDRFDYLYICGVTRRWSTNFHFVLRPCEGAVASATTYNGFGLAAQDAERVEIPALPDGYRGLPKEFTTCRNYQFGEAFYGSSASAAA